MAILITTESIVKTVSPKDRTFNIDDLNSLVEGWINPVKIGPLWVMYKEDCDDQPVNQIATAVFQVQLRGTVLVVPVQQLPREWDLMESTDYDFSGEEVDLGFLVSLQKCVSENQVNGVIFDTDIEEKEEWYYDPEIAESQESTDEFFSGIYPFFAEKVDYEDHILFEDEMTLIRVESTEEMKTVIRQMIDYFERKEEYEKCAQLNKILKDLE